MEPRYYDRRPRVVKVHGKALLEYEGQEPMNVLRSKVLFDQMDAKFGHAFRDSWSLESRLKDMDTEGWDIQVCLPTNGAGAPVHEDPEVAVALCRAYNNWAHDFCSGAPERVKFTAVVPGHSPEQMALETRRAIAELGAVSIFLPNAIPEKMWHHPDYYPVWEAVEELDVPLSVHGVSSSTGLPLTNARYEGMGGAFVALSEGIGFPFELVSEVSAPLSAAKWCDDRRNNT